MRSTARVVRPHGTADTFSDHSDAPRRRIRRPPVRGLRRHHARTKGPRLHPDAPRSAVRDLDRTRYDRTDEDHPCALQAAVCGDWRAGASTQHDSSRLAFEGMRPWTYSMV